METTGISKSALSGVGLTIGPGSYTGLRVGLSLAKGLAYTLGIPLLAIDTLEALYQSYRILATPADFYIPMLDARRMEVYGAIFDAGGALLQKSIPMVMDEKSFEELGDANIVCFGSGAEKLKELFASRPNVQFAGGAIPIMPGLFKSAGQAYASGQFADLAYLEPEYLKEYKAGTPKKLV
jgi:tRNA threonylcarbamoyladenosine biosynthesis protein TsaB